MSPDSSLALSCQNRYDQAVEAYKKALELEPNQESYKTNLKIAEEKAREMEQAARQAFGAAGGGPPNPGVRIPPTCMYS